MSQNIVAASPETKQIKPAQTSMLEIFSLFTHSREDEWMQNESSRTFWF